jgi:hypothetical protein
LPEPAVRVRALVCTLTAAAVLATAAGCGEETGGLPPPASPPPGTPSGPTPGPSLSPAEQEAVDEARARFDEFMNAYVEVSTADLPTAETAEDLFFEVEQHADGALPQELRSEIIGRWGEGQVVEGTLQWRLTDVVDVDLGYEVNGAVFPTVFLKYCIDATNWVVVKAETGEPTGEPGREQAWSVELSWSEDWGGLDLEGWRVVERQEAEGQRC